MPKIGDHQRKEGKMNRLLQIALILLLLIVAILQFMAARGIFPHRVIQEVCPVDAISMVNGKAVIDSIKCIGCGRCVDGFLAIPQDQQMQDFPQLQVALQSPKAELNPTFSMPDDTPQTPPQAEVQKAEPSHAPPKNQEAEESLADSTHQEAEESLADSLHQEDEQDGYFVVDSRTCISCSMCLRVCPVGAISYVDGKAYIDPELCINCGICAGSDPSLFQGCPVDAIHPAQP
jgi:ferredoxin